MTDSIRITLDLCKLSPLVRKDIDARIANVCTPWGEIREHYSKPTGQLSPLSGTKTKWIARCELDREREELGPIPYRIDADLNIPNAIVGHNVLHGTSVFAAGKVALELLRIWMAKSGLPRHELDRLTTEDVTLRGVTITYLIDCTAMEHAARLVDDVRVTGKVLNPRCSVDESTNTTVTLPERTYTVKAYNKTDLKYCKFPVESPKAALIEHGSQKVRLESVLGQTFLHEMGLLSLDNWRDAYAQGIYEQIFNKTVRKSLRLDEGLRHKAPRQEVYDSLSPTEAELLRGVVEEGRDPAEFESIAQSKSPAKRRSALGLSILKRTGVDIAIPWTEHVKLRCFTLKDRLVYPGDHRPSAISAPWCFCQDNWPELLGRLEQEYVAALAAAAERSTKGTM